MADPKDTQESAASVQSSSGAAAADAATATAPAASATSGAKAPGATGDSSEKTAPAASTPAGAVYRATRSFAANHETQLLRFEEGDEIPAHVAEPLRAKGCPIQPVR